MPAEITRIVSLLPSATEIVHGLGFGESLVGRSHECDFPAGVEALPVCTRPRVPLSGSSADIDRSVKAALKDAVAIYEVLNDQLEELSPGLVVTQDQCDVCAVSLSDVEAALAETLGNATRVVSLNPSDLAAVYADIRRVAASLNATSRGDDLVTAVEKRIEDVRLACAGGTSRPRVAAIEWCDPLMAGGNWVPELIDIAGGEDIFGTAGRHAPWIEETALLAADPDVIVFMPCGFGLERTRAEAETCLARQGWSGLSAVDAGRVYATDANAFFNRPGPRIADSAEIMGRLLHPKIMGTDGLGATWEPVRHA